ncbi:MULTISPECIES: OmpA family protein [unclassified Pseudomonas]|uniref:OmpA family protein n=1 Tax=unclassified Pseudomonas TaxID=196821 RepID=UPI0024470C24|nr:MULTISPECIES: OmpA family protein [unclassified Pseudomonas]MDG9922631.1 OmpA family protein [Pseudomonas sp. GD04045]MDH0033236.1 OmpA family protein [Pseudomonas sp. GD04019]
MLRSFQRELLLLLVVLLTSGCASSKSYVVLLESPDGSTGAIVVETAKGVTRIDKREHGVALDGADMNTFAVKRPRIDKDFAAAMAAQPTLPTTYLLYFKTGGTALTPQSKIAVQELLRTLRERGPTAVSVIGHTDTTSGSAWNEKLGLRRAQHVATMLQAAGLQALELIVTSHGESNLLVPTADETPEPKNRRVEVTLR